MNRAEMTRRVLLLEAAAAECRNRAAMVRADLDADARAELAEQGTAPTWRLADMGTWSLPISKETVYVSDEAALLAWVEKHYPDEVQTSKRVRPAFLGGLLGAVETAGDVVCVGGGEVVPGLAVRPGGTPQALRFKPSTDAQKVAAAAAESVVGEILSGLGVPDATP